MTRRDTEIGSEHATRRVEDPVPRPRARLVPILRRLTRWDPFPDQFPDRTPPRSPVRSSSSKLGFREERLREQGTVEDGPGPTEAAQVAAAAMAAAVRRQLIRPGSVPPAEQLSLMLADRKAHEFGGGATELGWLAELPFFRE